MQIVMNIDVFLKELYPVFPAFPPFLHNLAAKRSLPVRVYTILLLEQCAWWYGRNVGFTESGSTTNKVQLQEVEGTLTAEKQNDHAYNIYLHITCVVNQLTPARLQYESVDAFLPLVLSVDVMTDLFRARNINIHLSLPLCRLIRLKSESFQVQVTSKIQL